MSITTATTTLDRDAYEIISSHRTSDGWIAYVRYTGSGAIGIVNMSAASTVG